MKNHILNVFMMNAQRFQFHLVSPERTVYEGPADEVILPTAMGQITVLPDHIPLVSVIVPGEVIVRHNSSEELFAVTGGFLEVKGKTITLLADASEHVKEIDIERAETAKKRAQESLAKGVEGAERLEVSRAYERALVRLKVVGKIADRRGRDM